MGNELGVEVKELKAVADEVNALGVEEVDKIKTVAIFAPAMAFQFIGACDAVSQVDESLLSDAAVDVYNKLPSKKELTDMVDARDAEKGKKPKGKSKSAAKKEPKEKKERKKADPKPKSRYGHILSAKSGRLDDALFEGGTMENIMEKLQIPRTRFVGHSNHLKNDLGLTLVIKADKDKNTLKDHYSIKEESI